MKQDGTVVSSPSDSAVVRYRHTDTDTDTDTDTHTHTHTHTHTDTQTHTHTLCAFLFSFISYTSLKVPGLCKVVCEWCSMKSVTIVKVLVMVFAFSRTFVSGVFLSPGVEHGGQGGQGGQGTGTQRYDREFLIGLQTSQAPSDFPFELFPAEMTNRANVRKRRKRGKRGGVKRRMRRNKTKLPLPSMIVSNVRSINPKSPNHNFDELLANCRFTRQFRDTSLLCFSETWFTDKKVTGESVATDGFGEPYRMDRDSKQTGKERGGGVCLYVSEKFCDRANVTVK